MPVESTSHRGLRLGAPQIRVMGPLYMGNHQIRVMVIMHSPAMQWTKRAGLCDNAQSSCAVDEESMVM